MKKFTVVHRVDINNVGDLASNPLQYFLDRDEYDVIDIVDIDQQSYDSTLPLIIGGGGLINNDFFGDTLHNLLISADYNQLMQLWQQRWTLCDPANEDLHTEFLEKYQQFIKHYVDKLNTTKAKRFLWGIGHNGDVNRKKPQSVTYPSWLSDFDLIGVRDFKQNLPWVPCASCMHPALHKKYEIKNDVIWFEHKKQIIKDFGSDSIPLFVNSGSNIDQTIELLGSANVILTNSYHGAYWGTLLGKKVIVVGPWSSKFYLMRHQPVLISADDSWKAAVDKTKLYPDALDECVAATEKFWNKIKEQI